jgi:predicted transcriptional regulator
MITERPDENIVSEMFIAYVSNNKVEPSEVEEVVRAIGRALSQESSSELVTKNEPAVPMTCLEDGKQFKSIKRHLGLHGMTPDQYRTRWGLDDDYPMVAPKYARARSRLAKKIGLGRKRLN